MRKLLFPSMLFMFLLSISVVYGSDIVLIDESFPYLDLVTNQGWTSSGWGGCPNSTDITQGSLFGTYSIGINSTATGISDCGGAFQHDYDIVLDPIPTSGILLIEFDSFGAVGGTAGLTNPIGLHISTPSGLIGSDYITFWVGDGFAVNHDFKADCDSTSSFEYGCQECDMGDLSGLGLENFSAETSVVINFDDLFYNVTHIVDNVTYECGAVWASGVQDIFPESISVRNWYPTGRSTTSTMDNIFVRWSSSLIGQNTSLNEGFPCTSDSQCLSGFCDGGFCRLKNGGVECNSDSQCISGSCINNMCLKPSLWGNVDYSKTVLTGDDENNNNFIALIIMLFVGGFIAIGGASIGSSIIGGVAFLALGVFFTLVGWLNPFILFGIFFLLIASVGLLLLLGSKGS